MSEMSSEEIGVDTERAWFLYVGEIKAAGLNRFLVDPLSKRYGKPAVCIHIVPDVLAYYPEDIFLVIGPGSDLAGPDTPERTNSRMAASQFAATVSADEVVKALVDHISALPSLAQVPLSTVVYSSFPREARRGMRDEG